MATATAQALSPVAREFVERGPQRLVIGGESVEAADGRTFETVDPATGEAICEVAFAGPEDVERATGAARAALEGPLRKVSPSKRAGLMYALAELIKGNGDQLAELESLDNGKPLASAKGDIAATVGHLRYYAGWPTKIEGETIPVSARDVLCYTLREPVGVCAQIVPWNYPLLMAIWKVAPALAAGCAIVLKPAEQTPLTALRPGLQRGLAPVRPKRPVRRGGGAPRRICPRGEGRPGARPRNGVRPACLRGAVRAGEGIHRLGRLGGCGAGRGRLARQRRGGLGPDPRRRRLLRPPHPVHGCRGLDADRPRGDLRPGAGGDALREPRGGRPPRQRHGVRPRRRPLDPRRLQRPQARGDAPGGKRLRQHLGRRRPGSPLRRLQGLGHRAREGPRQPRRLPRDEDRLGPALAPTSRRSKRGAARSVRDVPPALRLQPACPSLTQPVIQLLTEEPPLRLLPGEQNDTAKTDGLLHLEDHRHRSPTARDDRPPSLTDALEDARGVAAQFSDRDLFDRLGRRLDDEHVAETLVSSHEAMRLSRGIGWRMIGHGIAPMAGLH